MGGSSLAMAQGAELRFRAPLANYHAGSLIFSSLFRRVTWVWLLANIAQIRGSHLTAQWKVFLQKRAVNHLF
ncbi:hypothetical protein L6452_15104 [Arctium lappa]|uniref:Uncharacterized protein n=1 Tax=Arctium lappa TaxID=4217 RepID=A0ACB9CNF2_ARCLA|nr:hypothetical protein L6452_15104 [Arctium lappa]